MTQQTLITSDFAIAKRMSATIDAVKEVLSYVRVHSKCGLPPPPSIFCKLGIARAGERHHQRIMLGQGLNPLASVCFSSTTILNESVTRILGRYTKPRFGLIMGALL